MDKLAGKTLVKKSGETVSADQALAGKKVVCYYFSAHWCPPCRQFTPILKDWYSEVADKGIEVVFVSSDQTDAAMKEYMNESHGDWLAVPHGSDLAQTLKSGYGISGIPSVIVVKRDGTVISKNGRSEIHSQGEQCADGWLKL